MVLSLLYAILCVLFFFDFRLNADFFTVLPVFWACNIPWCWVFFDISPMTSPIHLFFVFFFGIFGAFTLALIATNVARGVTPPP